MKYCIPYTKHSKFKDAVDELSILYDGQLAPLITFLQEHSTQRVILQIADERQFVKQAQIVALNDLGATYQLALCFGAHEKNHTHAPELLQLLPTITVDFFFGSLITSWEQLTYYLHLGVSDVYLAENMCFDLSLAKGACNAYNARIRVFPNVAQSNIDTEPDIKKFFIRPEDVESYELVVDVLEFWGDPKQADVYYLIYARKKRWLGSLNEIIVGLKEPINSQCISPLFAISRLNCRKTCSRLGHCSICTQTTDLADFFEKHSYVFRANKHN